MLQNWKTYYIEARWYAKFGVNLKTKVSQICFYHDGDLYVLLMK